MKKLLLILLLIPALSYAQITTDSLTCNSDTVDILYINGEDTTLFGDWRFETCGDWIIADSPLFGDWRFETYGEIIYTNIYYFMDDKGNRIAEYQYPDTLFIYLNDTTLVIPKERWQK